MYLGYNTNGLAHHDLADAIELLASIGYRGVAITIDHGALNPLTNDCQQQVRRVRRLLEKHAMRSVVETGARYLLDPHHKHEPTLVSATPAERARRVTFLQQAVDIARELGSDSVSLWSGVLHTRVGNREAFGWLVDSLQRVVAYAEGEGVVIGFEPEPGMLIDTMARYENLRRRIDATNFRLTLDIGHLQCLGEVPISEVIRHVAGPVVNVHIEDMRRGRHEHLMFGEGEIDFPPVIAALRDVGYHGGLHVELSRHSHEGPEAARRAFEFLSELMP
ncbi:MAG: sugar phosphate isomerase/epimerase family protein [Pirellulales bacterium]